MKKTLAEELRSYANILTESYFDDDFEDYEETMVKGLYVKDEDYHQTYINDDSENKLEVRGEWGRGEIIGPGGEYTYQHDDGYIIFRDDNNVEVDRIVAGDELAWLEKINSML